MSRIFVLTLLSAAVAFAQDPVKDLAARFEGKVSIYAKNLKTGAAYDLGGDTRVNTASTIKLPILIGVFTAVEAGKAHWTDTSELTTANKVGGSGFDAVTSGSCRSLIRSSPGAASVRIHRPSRVMPMVITATSRVSGWWSSTTFSARS